MKEIKRVPVKNTAVYKNKYYARRKQTRTSLGGIYKIECTETKSVYIGQSQNIESRILNHRNNLRSGKHVVCEMQKDYAKYGDQYFIFEAVHQSDDQNLLTLETYYIAQFEAEGYMLYNSIRVTDNLGMVQCDKENRNILQKISDMLDSGKLKTGELEDALFYKQMQC